MTRAGQRPTRRAFLRASVAAAPVIASRRLLAAPPPSRRIAMGFIGLGSHGTGHNLKSFLEEPDMEPVALCDVDSTHLERAAALVRERRGSALPASALTGDWREVVARRDVDAVMISTPDHWHVPIAVAALRAGKDVICEKPTLTIQEGQVLVETVRRYGRVFQASTEDRAIPVYHRIAELVRNGRIGRLRRILVTVPGPPWSEGPPPPPPARFDIRPAPVPPSLDWDMWLGPAPEAPYQPERVHYRQPAEGWRMIDDYAGGILTDWGTHMVDTAQWANDSELGGPVSVAGAGNFQSGLYDTAYHFRLDYRYADGVQLIIETGGTGLRFDGTDGWLAVPGWRKPLEGHPRSLLGSPVGPSEERLPTDPRGEHRNFLDCVRSRRDPYFPVEKLHRLSSLLHVGNLCLKLGRPLRWDPAGESFPGDVAANRLRVRALRAPWHL